MTTKITSAAAVLGKLGGSVKSDTKAISSRENGKLGGRPRKINQVESTINQTTGSVVKYRVRDGWTFTGNIWAVDTESAKWRERFEAVRVLCDEDTDDLEDWMLNGGADPYTLSPRTIARQYDEQARDWAVQGE